MERQACQSGSARTLRRSAANHDCLHLKDVQIDGIQLRLFSKPSLVSSKPYGPCVPTGLLSWSLQVPTSKGGAQAVQAARRAQELGQSRWPGRAASDRPQGRCWRHCQPAASQHPRAGRHAGPPQVQPLSDAVNSGSVKEFVARQGVLCATQAAQAFSLAQAARNQEPNNGARCNHETTRIGVQRPAQVTARCLAGRHAPRRLLDPLHRTCRCLGVSLHVCWPSQLQRDPAETCHAYIQLDTCVANAG